MWIDESRPAVTRVHRRRTIAALILGIVAGAVAVATVAGLLPMLAGAIPVLAALGGASLLASSPERLLSPAPLPVAEDEVREVRIGHLGASVLRGTRRAGLGSRAGDIVGDEPPRLRCFGSGPAGQSVGRDSMRATRPLPAKHR